MTIKTGSNLTDGELLAQALDDLLSAVESLYEIETDEGRVLAAMAHTLVKCTRCAISGSDPRDEE